MFASGPEESALRSGKFLSHTSHVRVNFFSQYAYYMHIICFALLCFAGEFTKRGLMPGMTRGRNDVYPSGSCEPLVMHKLAPEGKSDKRKDRQQPQVPPMVRQARKLWLKAAVLSMPSATEA